MQLSRARMVLFASVTGVAAIFAIAGMLAIDRLGSPSFIVSIPVSDPVMVYIDGAVATPGLYQLQDSPRLQNAIDAAGGLLPGASTVGLNLAARLGDGEHVTIPTQSTTSVPDEGTPRTGHGESGALVVNINTASVDQLEELPGIGPVLAQRIVDYRDLNGPFTSIDQLEDVEGISAATVEELRPLVVLR